MLRCDQPVLFTVAAALVRLFGGLAMSAPAGASAAVRQAAVHPAMRDSRPGANLLLNPGAQVGAYSAQGWDAVTIPGWRISGRLPTVVRYGTGRYPRVTGHRAVAVAG